MPRKNMSFFMLLMQPDLSPTHSSIKETSDNLLTNDGAELQVEEKTSLRTDKEATTKGEERDLRTNDTRYRAEEDVIHNDEKTRQVPLNTEEEKSEEPKVKETLRGKQQQLYINTGDTLIQKRTTSLETNSEDQISEDELTDDDKPVAKRCKSKRRRCKRKNKKSRLQKQEIRKNIESENHSSHDSKIDVDIEYVQEVMDASDPLYSHFMEVFEKFKLTENVIENDGTSDAAKRDMLLSFGIQNKPVDMYGEEDDEGEDYNNMDKDKPKLSKRKLKKLNQMSVAELKLKVNKPELVEMHDINAKDPLLLLQLKASRNSVPVPRHWCFKRKYLQGKRGIEKPAFELPDCIKMTGIMEIRQAMQEKEDQKMLKSKMRQRLRPKLGKIEIDYQKLQDAFFKWNFKPKLTKHGELYYEGKEFDINLRQKKPGNLNEDLRIALGMPTGHNANKCPPPWLIAMQRYGPPPSYPNLKIPGLNAPIPDGCSFGYHAGGWGKPPVDEFRRPLYGDVFGTQTLNNQPCTPKEEIDQTLWGGIESEEESEEEEKTEVNTEVVPLTETKTESVSLAEGLITPSGITSVSTDIEIPDMNELRKCKIKTEVEDEKPALFQVLPEKKVDAIGTAIMGSTHIYDLASATPGGKLKASSATAAPPQSVEISLDPTELEMDSADIAARYEQNMSEFQLRKEDFSDEVAKHIAKQKKKRKKRHDSSKPSKKYKDFSF